MKLAALPLGLLHRHYVSLAGNNAGIIEKQQAGAGIGSPPNSTNQRKDFQMSKLQSLKAAMKRAEAPFNSTAFRQTCDALGINDNWGYRFSAMKRTVEIELASPARAAYLCMHHGAEAITQAEWFYLNIVLPFPEADFQGTKTLWQNFPLNLRTRLQPVFNCAEQFEGIAEIEERFLLWEGGYHWHFASIAQVVSLEKKHKAKTEFHRLYVRAFKAQLPEQEEILSELVGLAR